MVNYNENIYVRRGAEGRDHIPALPFWMAILRVVQLILAFLVMILCAYASATFGGDNSNATYLVNSIFPGYNMSFFTFAWTILFLLYIFLTPLAYPKYYLSYAHLGLELLTVIFWLTSFALLADECKFWVLIQDSAEDAKKSADDSFFEYDTSELNKEISASKASRAATGFAAINWLLFMVTFGFVVYYWNKHRTGHGNSIPFSHRSGDVEAKPTANVEIHNVPQQEPYPQYPQGQQQQQYPQQPYPQATYQQPQHP